MPLLRPLRQSCSVCWIGLTACWLLPWLSGCSQMFTPPLTPAAKSILQPAQTAPDSVTLEIFQLRVPATDTELTDQLWQAADEQHLSVESRRGLIGNGFRVGVLGGALPDVLARRLNLQSEMPAATDERVITDQSADPRAVRRVVQLNRHESATIQVTDLQDQRHVLISGQGGLKGRSFQQVQAVYSMRAEPMPGQRVALSLIPELHHGEMRNRYTGSEQGIFLITPSREQETYEQFELAAELSAGELLVVSCLPDSPGSLGHAFHAIDRAGATEHKLLLVRLLQVPGSEILADAAFASR
ncbi:MAG: hypothetical protein KDA57_00210 [Planctomycetales bacterium]|nr:hypothetical protein [Planctomycetales bacterium]